MMAPKRKSASSAVLKEVQQQDSETVTPLNRETVEQQSGETGELYYGETAERLISNTVTQQHGITALLQEVRDLISNRSVYEWGEVQEPGTSQEKIPAETDSRPRLKRYLNE